MIIFEKKLGTGRETETVTRLPTVSTATAVPSLSVLLRPAAKFAAASTSAAVAPGTLRAFAALMAAASAADCASDLPAYQRPVSTARPANPNKATRDSATTVRTLPPSCAASEPERAPCHLIKFPSPPAVAVLPPVRQGRNVRRRALTIREDGAVRED